MGDKLMKQWDDKFGWIDTNLKEVLEANDIDTDNFTQRAKETCKIQGVGRDAEIITNAAGGKQSKSPMAMHLIDPHFLYDCADEKCNQLEYLDEDDVTTVDDADQPLYDKWSAIRWIAHYMSNYNIVSLNCAMQELEPDEGNVLIRIAKVLQVGAERYAPNNWRLIPQEEHINHALIHLLADIIGDKQDDHIDHALCRLMMALSTELSDGFKFGEYVK